MAFAHEIGHNLGAKHDSEDGCDPTGYLMGEMIEKETSKLSSCTKTSIKQTMNIRRISSKTCFTKTKSKPEKVSVCGDFYVDGEEECDCGISYRHCKDACCYAGNRFKFMEKCNC